MSSEDSQRFWKVTGAATALALKAQNALKKVPVEKAAQGVIDTAKQAYDHRVDLRWAGGKAKDTVKFIADSGAKDFVKNNVIPNARNIAPEAKDAFISVAKGAIDIFIKK